MTRKLLFQLFALLVPLAATERAGAADNLVAAYPASVRADCAGIACNDTLRENHALTFISRLAFPQGSALLTRDAKSELLRLLVELESFGVVEQVEIVGHADPSGPENFNIWLTGRRAERVQDHLAQCGVDPRKMAARGAGSSEPLHGAIDPAEHRRLELRITVRPFL